jgi:glycosyltransferase involved in cell wall biosynthesis
LIRRHKLDVLHAHQYTPFFYGSLAARFARVGTRVIFTEHGRHWPDIVSRKRRLANQLILKRLAHRITAVCDFSARALSDRDGFPPSLVQVIENGIDVGRYGPAADRSALKRKLGLDPSRRYVACIARFHPVKDHGTLLQAFATVSRTLDDVDLLLVGDGPLRPELDTLVDSLGIRGRTIFLGVRQDVPEILAAIDVFALSSLSEAASITVLEAMATGVPIVITNVGGNPEMVRDGIDGLLTPRGDAGAMAAGMTRLLQERGLAERMGSLAAARARSDYRLDRTVDRYFELYQQFAARPPRDGA